MKTYENAWSEEHFEDMVATTLIACFETKFKKNKGAAPQDRLTDERIAIIRNEGPFIPGPGSVVQAPDGDKEPWNVHTPLDHLPVKGVYAMKPHGLMQQSSPNAYLFCMAVRQAKALGKGWYQQKAGILYEAYSMFCYPDHIAGDRRFFNVTPKGEVSICIPYLDAAPRPGAAVVRHIPEGDELEADTVWSTASIQLLAGRRTQWVITAKESGAKAHLGCMSEEVKSLLYARSLPMTSTGRKRPILHLVESHKRRLKNGTDIDITSFLKGQQDVEIGGTHFKVNPPVSLLDSLTKASQDRYFKHD